MNFIQNGTPTVNPFINSLKIGFLGCGNMAQAMIKGMLQSKIVRPQQLFASNRSSGRLQKVKDLYDINICSGNEEMIEKSQLIFLGAKPQDLLSAIEPVSSIFTSDQIVISLAAGIPFSTLEKFIPQVRWGRLMPNTPTLISRGVLGYLFNEKDDSADAILQDLLKPLGYVVSVPDEEQLDALMVACSSGTGFVFELMIYWTDWLEEHGFDKNLAKEMTVQTFLGASELATGNTNLEDLQAKVTSKKGVTAAGLDSIRELELERVLRISFEKAAMRSQELSKLKE